MTKTQTFTGRPVHLATLVSKVHTMIGGWDKGDFLYAAAVCDAAATKLGFEISGRTISANRANAIIESVQESAS